MKKLFLAGALALFGVMNAQTEKGSWVIGGSTTLGFNSVSTKYSGGGQSADGPTVSTITVTPSVGYFVIDKLAVGVDLGVTSITSKQGNTKDTVSSFTVMPTGTYYFRNAGNIIPYVGAGVGYGSVTQSGTYNNQSVSDSESGFAWKAKGGLVYLINQTVGIDLGVGYNQFTSKKNYSGVDVTTQVGTIGANLGFSLFLK
ncbi:porin family protein [Chryseobacterium suipulveris]|uniref:Porin family protein n=1 Tax=Chryseobacterium suipulveris TaxID=2929800 RepID=A0ABY4BS77_9FLAO|nr:OmpW family outer membrane protein [Chryseobacterium suipulveris]UOE42053.1 porin family protein [Chryseobacterium suipulveris]